MKKKKTLESLGGPCFLASMLAFVRFSSILVDLNILASCM